MSIWPGVPLVLAVALVRDHDFFGFGDVAVSGGNLGKGGGLVVQYCW